MKGLFKKASILLALLVAAIMVTACSGDDNDAHDYWPGHITVDLFNDAHTGFAGIQPGWFGQVVNERFNMDINHIGAPDGEFELIFSTRAAAGNLGDLIFVGQPRMHEVIEAGLVINITDQVNNNMPYYTSQFPGAVERARTFSLSGEIYALPTDVTTQSRTQPRFTGIHVARSPWLRFDVYQAIGAPTIDTLEDLLPVLAAMQEYMPYTETGRRTYGFSLFGDWDGLVMAQAEWFDQMYGLTRFLGPAALSVDPINHRVESRIDNDGIYKRGLRLLFNANQMGLVDPDSPTQNFDMVSDKGAEGAVLFSWYNWLVASRFNSAVIDEDNDPYFTNAHVGVGYTFVPIMDQTVLIPSMNPNGTDMLIAIGPSATDVDRLIAFIDWMASPDGHEVVTLGPEGMAWEMVGGEPVVTALGIEGGLHTVAFQPAAVPEEWGGSTFSDGSWQGRSTIVNRWGGQEMNPNRGFTFDPRHWPSQHRETTVLEANWTERFGAANQVEWLLEHDMLVARPAIDFNIPEDPSELSIIRGEVGPIIQSASWRMVFASDEAEFNQIWAEMREIAYGLGWQQLVDFEYQIAQDYFAAQRAAMGN